MAIRLSPPPLTIPGEFAAEKTKAAFFNGLLNTIYQLWTTVYAIRSTATLKTTDATPTGIVRIPVEEGKTVMIRADVVARRTGGIAGLVGDSAWYTLSGAYKNIAGVLTGIGTPDLIGGEDQSGWDLSFSSSGTFAVIVATGAVNNNITWEGSFYAYTVGS